MRHYPIIHSLFILFLPSSVLLFSFNHHLLFLFFTFYSFICRSTNKKNYNENKMKVDDKRNGFMNRRLLFFSLYLHKSKHISSYYDHHHDYYYSLYYYHLFIFYTFKYYAVFIIARMTLNLFLHLYQFILLHLI